MPQLYYYNIVIDTNGGLINFLQYLYGYGHLQF